jgi:hypothetical protein
MNHTIVTPTEIEHPLYTGSLEFVPEVSDSDDLYRGAGVSREKPNRPGPMVTLGQSQWWNLARLAREKGESLPAELSLLLHDADFYLLQLACSFKPERDSQVTWAQFNVYLRPKIGPETPIAFDLYPREIYDESQTDVQVSIGPSLKFADVELALGQAVTTIEFRRIEPVIVGFGALQSDPGWDFEAHNNHPLRGAKFSYLIVKKPHSAEAVRLTLDISAEVETKQGLFKAKVTERDRAHLSQVICTD